MRLSKPQPRPMITASEYRKLAGECFRLACQTQPQAVRQAYLDLAQLWFEKASRLDEMESVSEIMPEPLELTY